METSSKETLSAPATGTSSKNIENDAKVALTRHEEYQYLDLVREILETGEHRPDR